MTSDMDADVLIVGGGMVGTTLAVALASADVPVAIIDRDTPDQIAHPIRDGRASAIASGSQAVLDVLGVWPRVAADAQPILQVRVSDADSLLFLHYDHRDIGDKPLGAIVENHVIHRALNARLASSVNGSTAMTCVQFAQSRLRTRSRIGEPSVSPWRTPPRISARSVSIAWRAPRP